MPRAQLKSDFRTSHTIGGLGADRPPIVWLVRKSDFSWARGIPRWRGSATGGGGGGSGGCGQQLAGVWVDGLDGDVVAEAFEAADVVAGLAADVHALFVIAGAEVLVAGVGVREQGMEDGQDGVAGGDEGFLFGHALDKPPVFGAEEGLGAAGADADFAEGGGQVGVAAAGDRKSTRLNS